MNNNDYIQILRRGVIYHLCLNVNGSLIEVETWMNNNHIPRETRCAMLWSQSNHANKPRIAQMGNKKLWIASKFLLIHVNVMR